MTADIAKPSEKNWLVKSSGRVFGPYTLEELTEMLCSHQISIIDEVRQPQGRWGYIREIQLFMEIVKNIREQQDGASENTMTLSLAQHSFTKTDASGNTISDDLTPTPFSSHTDPSGANKTQSDLKDITSASERSVKAGSSPEISSQKSYGSTDDQHVQNKLQRQSNLSRNLALAVLGLAALGLVLTFSLKDRRNYAGQENLLNQALRYKSLGLFEKSLKAYKKAIAIKEPDLETQIQMAPVLISEDRQSLQGRRILERSLMQEGRSREDLINAYLGISVSFMMDGDLKEAEDMLQKTIGFDPSNVQAMLNLAIVQMKKGNYSQAMKDFEAVHRKSPNLVIALFGRAMSALEYAKITSDRSFLKPLVSDIKLNVKNKGYLHQELNLLMVYALNLLSDTDQLNQGVLEFLDSEVGLADKYSHPLFIDWRFTQWDYLEKYCSEFFDKSVQTAEMKALRSKCLLEVNRDAEAQKILQEALSEGPKDPYVLAVQAIYLNKIGRQPESSAILRMPELTALHVKNQLLGDICMAAQDTSCAEPLYLHAYEKDKKNVASLYGMAWVKIKKKDRASAYDFVRAGLEVEANYVPLLELRDQLESE